MSKKILQEQDEKERAEYEELIPMFERMEKLAAILRKKRMKRGSIDFDFPETKIILDKKGNPVDIRRMSGMLQQRSLKILC